MCMVSVLVPICNVEKYLEKCLESLSHQTLQDMEIICLNDGSTDSSGEIAHRFEVIDERFSVIDKTNSGYGKTMNLGLSLAKGKYVGIVESDDFVEPCMFQKLLEVAEKYEADVVKSAFWTHYNGYDKFEEVIVDDLYDKVVSAELCIEMFEYNPSIWSNLYNRAFLKENGIYFSESPGASFQDMAWRMKIFVMAKCVIFIKQPLYHYRRDNLAASVKGDNKIFCVCDEYDEAEQYLREKPNWDSRYRFLITYIRWNHYFWNCFERWLSLGSQWIFFKRMKEDFARYEAEGRIRQAFWRRNALFNMQSMLWDSQRFFFEHYLENLRKRVIIKGFFSLLDEASHLVIYGAGKVGREALSALCLHGRYPVCFVVSNMDGNEKYVDGVIVRSIEDLTINKSDYVILIATNMATQPQILEMLLEKGFTQIISFLPEVRQALKT